MVIFVEINENLWLSQYMMLGNLHKFLKPNFFNNENGSDNICLSQLLKL